MNLRDFRLSVNHHLQSFRYLLDFRLMTIEIFLEKGRIYAGQKGGPYNKIYNNLRFPFKRYRKVFYDLVEFGLCYCLVRSFNIMP